MFIAYVLPGFLLLASASLLVSPLQIWLLGPAPDAPSVGGVVYVTAGSILLGMVIGVIRWAVIDTLHAVTGLRRPVWNERLLPERLEAFQLLVQNHFRYYEFYGNTAVALPLAWTCLRLSPASSAIPIGLVDAGVVILTLLLIVASRDALRRYFLRSADLLGKEPAAMTNGNHPKPTKPADTPKRDRLDRESKDNASKATSTKS